MYAHVAHLLLAMAVTSVWVPAVPIGRRDGRRLAIWPVFFVLAVVAAIAAEVVDHRAMLAITVLCGLVILAKRMSAQGRKTWANWTNAVAVFVLFCFAIQRFPGFTGTTIVSGVHLSPDAASMRLVERFDVGVAGLFLLALYSRRVESWADLREIVGRTVSVALITVAVVLATAVLAGFVRVDPKWPPFTLQYLTKTLFVTAVVEEAFFRGVLQDRLSGLMKDKGWRGAMVVPTVVSAVLFGLAHAPGGWMLAALATLAGLGYAVAYATTQRIEAPIAVHFLFNASHFLLFTYPHLAVTP